MIPCVLFNGTSLFILLASYLGAVGTLMFLGFLSSIYNDTKYDLKASTFFNWKGNTPMQYVFGMVVFLMYFAAAFLLTYIYSGNTTLIWISGLGIIFIVLHRVWISYLAQYYNKNALNKEVDAVLSDFVPFMADEILRQKKIIGKFSKGNKQKIGIIGAMLLRPKLLILDEPFNFLDPTSQIILKRLLQTYNQQYGTTILLSSHNLQHVMDICSRIIVLESGKIAMDENNIDNNTKSVIENYFCYEN